MKTNKLASILLLFLLLAFTGPLTAQTTKQVNYQAQTWVSINSTLRFNDRWSVLLDLHERRNHFMADGSFEFVRGALQYNIDKNLAVAAGYGHMWLHPTTPGWKTISNENRIYQQVTLTSKVHSISILQRLRNEQRWQQKISGDKFTGKDRFTDRVRYLLSLTIPVFKNPKLPALNISDEIALQAGKEVVYNTFDQNRLFAGIKQKITKDLSFDAGYMIVFQQKYAATQYDFNNTYRVFFYYSPMLKKHKA